MLRKHKLLGWVGIPYVTMAMLLMPAGWVWGGSPRVESEIEVLDPEVTLDLEPGRSKLIRTKRPVLRFSITRPEVVEVVQLGPAEFELIAGRAGQTSMTVWFRGSGPEPIALRYLVRVSRQ